jgi:hypothetical protein
VKGFVCNIYLFLKDGAEQLTHFKEIHVLLVNGDKSK